MKKILFTFLLLAPFIFFADNVYADSFINEAPSFSDRYYLNGSTFEGVYEKTVLNLQIASGFGYNVYANGYNYFYYTGTDSDIMENMGIQWNSKDWCKQSEINFTGYLVPHSTMISTSFFYNASNFNLYLETDTGSYLCSINKTVLDVPGGQVSALKFSCNAPKSTATTRNFKFLLNFNSFPSNNGAYWGIQQGSFKYSCDIDNTDVLNNQNQNTQNIINNQNQNTQNEINNANKNQAQTNEKLDNLNKNQQATNDFLKDNTAPNSDISSLGNVQGLLPPGPVDSLLNIPFEFLSIVTTSCAGQCVPLEGNFVFDSRLSIPCFDSFYDEVPVYLMYFINLIPSAFILIKYFKHLYKKVDRAVSMNSNSDDEWGVL